MIERKARERCYAPARSTGYLHRLLLHDQHGGGVSGTRSNAVRYIVYVRIYAVNLGYLAFNYGVHFGISISVIC
jgi:hypothetical protein